VVVIVVGGAVATADLFNYFSVMVIFIRESTVNSVHLPCVMCYVHVSSVNRFDCFLLFCVFL